MADRLQFLCVLCVRLSFAAGTAALRDRVAAAGVAAVWSRVVECAPLKRAILFFVKFPEPGKVKTRLAADIGPERAAEIYRALTETVCARLRAAVDCALLVFFDPAEKKSAIESWLRPLLNERAQFIPQSVGDLGARLTDAFARAFSAGFEKAAAIGSDCAPIRSIQNGWRPIEPPRQSV